jgi:hypothetical protein
MKHVLVLGASGLVAPYVTPGLEACCHLHLADVKPHPFGKPVQRVDIADYGQVLGAMQGMDAAMNFTTVRSHPALSFAVNVRGAYHVMKAAANLGVRKVIHTGPQMIRRAYDEDFDIVDVPRQPGTDYYGLTKYLSYDLCRIYARTYDIQTICFVFNGLGNRPEAPVKGRDFPPFQIVWEDLQHACRLALEIERLPDSFQTFNMHSYAGHGKYRLDKAERLLGYAPLERWEAYFRRDPTP